MKREYISIAIFLALLFTVAMVYPYDRGGPKEARITIGLSDASAQIAPTHTYDVVVVGAGSGGISAAISAARRGMKVAILEETDIVGGQLAPVPNMDGGNTLGSGTGIYKEFIDRVATYYATPGRFPEPKSVGTCYWYYLTRCFEPKVGRNILLSMLNSSGVTVRTGVKVNAVNKISNIVTGVKLADGTTYNAKITMDATEYGDLMPLAGVKYRVGNVKGGEAYDDNACVQSITYVAPIKQYASVPTGLTIKTKPPNYDTFLPEYKAVVTKDGFASWSGKYPVNFLVHNAYRGVPDSTNPKNYVATVTGEGITKTMINWANDYPATNLSVKYIEDTTYRASVNCSAKLKTLGLFIIYKMSWATATGVLPMMKNLIPL
jgi:hypothetical protein